MVSSSISIDIDDPRTGLVAEALANKTCVKILGLLAEKDLTASDIAVKLGIPLNTTGYNIEKLIASGLVEKSSDFFWSVKGKKTPVYKVANRRIVISPKRVIKGVLPAVILSGFFALILRKFSFVSEKVSSENSVSSAIPQLDVAVSTGVESASKISADLPIIAQNVSSVAQTTNSWVWFFAGALFSLIVFFVWDWIFGGKNEINFN